MDVKACDNCKKLNTEEPLFAIMEGRKSSARGEFPTPSDPIFAFRVATMNSPRENVIEEAYPGNGAILCRTCADKRINALFAAL